MELIDGYGAEISHRIRRTICLAGGEAITRLGGLAAKAYGTTYEPVVFIYNKRLIPQNEVPDSHTALAKLIASRADKFKGKVTTYDIEKSGLGFMLAVQDSRADANYFADSANIAKGGLTVQSSTGTMMERVSSGENLIGYNILGSYAEARAKNDPL